MTGNLPRTKPWKPLLLLPDLQRLLLAGATCLAPLLSTASAVPTTANQGEFISQFLRKVGLPSSVAIGDLPPMWEALMNRLGDGQPPVGDLP